MTLPHDPQGVLVLPWLRIQNANAISGPFTHGFPALTAFLGFMWALERRLASADIGMVLEKVGIVCHGHEEQVQPGYVQTFRLTRNPVDKSGGSAAIVEEGRMHLDLTLVFQVAYDVDGPLAPALGDRDAAARTQLMTRIADIVASMRVAGGSVLAGPARRRLPRWFVWPDSALERANTMRTLRRSLLPGFALVGRDDLLLPRLNQLRAENPDATLLDAWLDLSRFNFRGALDDDGRVVWRHDRPVSAGWLVPVPVGYAALTPLYPAGEVLNTRDPSTPVRFVESVYSLGQWLSPHRLSTISDLFWWSESDVALGLYRARNGYRPPADEQVNEMESDGAWAMPSVTTGTL